MPRSCPAAYTSSQTARPYQPDTLISKASSPENEIRQIRAGTPEPRVVSRKVMNGNASLDTSRSGATRATTSRERGPTTAMVVHCSVTEVQHHVELGPLGLQPFLQPVQDARGAAGGGGHEVAVVREPQGDAVVEHHPVRRAHHAVARRADGQLLEPVGVDPVEELAGVRATDLHLAEGRGVHHRDTLARGPALTCDRGVHVLPRLRVVPRPQPLADDLHLGAVLDVPGVHRRGALGVEEVAALASGERRERDRDVRRPVGRRPDLPHARAVRTVGQRRGDHADRRHA